MSNRPVRKIRTGISIAGKHRCRFEGERCRDDWNHRLSRNGLAGIASFLDFGFLLLVAQRRLIDFADTLAIEAKRHPVKDMMRLGLKAA